MRLAPLLGPFVVALCAAPVSAQVHSITFSGEVSENQVFRKQIAQGLDFVLTPNTMQPGVITGWIIEVSPHIRPTDPQCHDFAWAVTPPYHFQNARYLDTSYNTLAQDAVGASPRDFKFVLNCVDLKAEWERVNRVLQPLDYSKSEVEEARAKLGSSPAGTGRLWIEDYKITPGERSSPGVDLGKIRWIRFKVQINLPVDQDSQQAAP
jgi:hypothetical protein